MDEEIEICFECEIGHFIDTKDCLDGRTIRKCSYCGFIQKVFM